MEIDKNKKIKISPLNDELIEAIDVEVWSPEQPEWFVDWFSNKSDTESELSLEQINWILNECDASIDYSKKLMDENNNEDTNSDYAHTLENAKLIKDFFNQLIKSQN